MTTRISNIATGESYLVESIDECRDYTDRLVYKRFLELGSVCVGRVLVESVVLEKDKE